jgi:hypothetical protein
MRGIAYSQAMSKPFNMIHDIVEANGKTIKENNLAKPHNIPIGTLVEAKFDEWFGEGACWKVHARMWIVSHDRDCDGTPLYSISRWNDPEFAKQNRLLHSGFPEEWLTPIEITDRIREGYDTLDWGRD